ncbi:transcription factor bHLH149 [Arachis ipaensis]|uniref:transcription factor bHLH149 n=1 Tax=Arachis ipaensis TaxID=130454 RepID=UPI0007AF66E1|nr:transcription factor bHLH149 [Arachis ipaensis]
MASLESIINAPEPSTNNPETTSPDSDSNPNKRRKIGHRTVAADASLNHLHWTSQSEQQIYSINLLRTLRHVLRRNPSPSTTASKPRQVRYAADRVLAAAAKGRTRWSRAILSSPPPFNNRRMLHKKAPAARKKVTGLRSMRNGTEKKKLPAVERKTRVLSRLVPGCRKLSFPNLLEEATDYISALEMQVRAMTALAELLAGGGSPSGLAGESLS